MNDNFSLPPGFLAGLEPLSRRRLLTGSAGLAVAAGSLLALPAEALAASKDLPPGITNLSETEYRVLDKVRIVMLPTQKFSLPSSTEIPVMKNVDVVASRLDGRPRLLLTMAVQAIEYGSVWQFSRFSAMGDSRAARHVSSWQTGNFIQRGIISSLKMMVTFGYWQDPRTWPALEYDGPVTEKWGIRRLGNAPQPRS
jgi:hypothetical protein